MQELIDISAFCEQTAFGGVVTLEYISTKHIQSAPEDYELQNALDVTTPVVPLPGYSWNKVLVYPESVDLDEKSDTTKQGYLVKTIIKGEFPSKVNEIRRLYDRMLRHRYILRMVTSEKDTLIIGTLQTPLTFSVKNTRGKKIPDGHKFFFQFDGITQFLAYIYNV